MRKTIPAWWPQEPRPGNFGDILTPYLVKKIAGINPTYTNKGFGQYPTNLLAVGSIIKFANSKTVVWGSGTMRNSDKLSKEADYRAVRGPMTRDIILRDGGECPEIYGDPGLLLPSFYTPKSERKYRLGIIPHYVDYAHVKKFYGDDADIKIINLVNADIESVIDDINECENVVSSSLHGIIAAHAYGVNAVWSKFSDKLHGDGIKFRDYFASVDVEMECRIMTDLLPKSDLLTMEYVGGITYDPNPLIKAFPHDRF